MLHRHKAVYNLLSAFFGTQAPLVFCHKLQFFHHTNTAFTMRILICKIQRPSPISQPSSKADVICSALPRDVCDSIFLLFGCFFGCHSMRGRFLPSLQLKRIKRIVISIKRCDENNSCSLLITTCAL
ncbi:hypothetical protein BX070DRAFT_91647 [Coemansia spiralis]|nr:hypothetical protein BX070DRAFT_91647 [Coemansia spiralis]